MAFKSVLAASAAVSLCATASFAGGLDRSRLAYGAMFEDGRYIELGFSRVNPSVSGSYTGGLAGLGASTGSMAEGYTTYSFAYKADAGDRLSYGLFVNTPYGADANYLSGAYRGLEAHWDSNQTAALLRYELGGGFSVTGGARAVTSKADIVLPDLLMRGGLAQAAGALAAQAAQVAPVDPALAAQLGAAAGAYGALAGSATDLTYTAKGKSDTQVGAILGVAYERPDIALRVGLTYEQGVTHSFDTTEIGAILGVLGAPTTRRDITEVEIPDAITLDFQTGIAADTLLFGSVRYAEWSLWEVRPQGYDATFADSITEFDNNVVTWQLGVGRKVNDNLSVFARASYEKANGGIASRLSPTDGMRGLGIGATWRQDNMKITGGLEYAKLGDAVDASGTRFEGNSALGVGVTVGFSF